MLNKIIVAGAAALGLAAAAHAQDGAAAVEDPECVAPAQPGGGFDLTCRIAQNGLEPHLSEPMQVTFMPGGIGAVAINAFNTTRADDASAIVAFSSGSLLNMATGKYGDYGEEDVRFLASAGADFGAVIVRADSEYETLEQLMAALEEGAGDVVFGAGGSVGSQDWMKGALLLRSQGLDPRDMRYVAFDGGGEAIAALLGGSIEVYTGDVGEMTSYMDSGDMRILAVMSPERLPEPFAEIPTTAELGYPDAEWTILRGYYMAPDAPQDSYDAYVEAFRAAYETEAFDEIVRGQGLQPLEMAGEEFQDDVMGRVERMRQVAQEAGLI